ncbi:Ankyrin repeat domain containing protein [Pandoravirus dulcis]|uniref:Ankyrin repeat domain containing protein n=1 Tax=Pandoravirus dulcis TaxID=1349409 RepID=S4VP70_9VIRU|nr:Ankyrin repeat domain containing protein [Pandoravirus dulcis]AGO82078.2 Ankyrin repeat domain containing protein [Pandoravirus dulcis]
MKGHRAPSDRARCRGATNAHASRSQKRKPCLEGEKIQEKYQKGQRRVIDSLSMNRFPDEILAAVLAWMPCVTLDGPVSGVCVRWRRLARDRAAVGRRESCVEHALATQRSEMSQRCVLVQSETCDPRRIALSYERRLCAAAASGHVGCAAHIHNPMLAWPYRVVSHAAQGGHVHMLAWLWRRGCAFKATDMYAAARHGRVDCMAYLYDRICPRHHDDWWPLFCAAGSGHVAAVAWLRGHGYVWHREIVAEALRKGHADVATWMIANGCPWPPKMPVAAARDGHSDVLRAMLDRGLAIGADLCEAVIKGGNCACVALLCERAPPWSTRHSALAATAGRLDLVEMLCAAGCPCDAGVLSAARAAGHDRVVTWLHARCCA